MLARRIWKSWIAGLFALLPLAAAAEIYDTVETPDMSVVFSKALELRAQTNKAGKPKEVLVAFDTDNTLLVLDQTLGSEQWFETQNTELGAHSFSKLLAVNDALTNVSKATSTEPYNGRYFAELRAKGVKIMVITSRGVELAPITVRSLNDNGMTFSYPGTIRFQGPREEIVCPEGICLTSGQDKGQALLGFLRAAQDHPDAVIFVDNDPHYPHGHHERMINAVKTAGNPFDLYTYRYTRYNHTLTEYAQGDRSVATAELIDFEHRGCLEKICDRVMPDEEAQIWIQRHCASHTQAEMKPLMDHWIYGDPLPPQGPCRP